MRILILGGDGYLGWPTALHLSDRGHDVAIGDNFVRRQYDHEMGVESLVPIAPLHTRIRAWHEHTGRLIDTFVADLTDAHATFDMIDRFRPDTIIHFAEQRAAPYSMIDREHAVYTQYNNVIGTLNVLYAIKETDPDIHLVKLGTMGEYGTPNIDIEEGWLELSHKGRTDRVLYPKRPGSFYHLSKVHDSHNVEFACRVWGLRATDLNQGVVYGQETSQTAVHDVVVVGLGFDARVLDVLDARLTGIRGRDDLCDLGHGEALGDLVEHPELARIGRLLGGQAQAFNGVADVDDAPGLPAPAVDRQRLAEHRLHDEAVQNGPEDRVVVEAGSEAVVESGRGGLLPVHDALVQIGGA